MQICLVGHDDPWRAWLAAELQELGHQPTCGEIPADWLRPGPITTADVLLIAAAVDPPAPGTLRDRATVSPPENLAILVYGTPDQLEHAVRWLEAGADEWLAIPTDRGQLELRIELARRRVAVAERQRRDHALEQARSAEARQRAEAATQENRNRLEIATQQGQVCIWDTNLQTGQTTANALFFEWLGLPPVDGPQPLEFWQQLLPPTEWERINTEAARYLRDGFPEYSIEYRIYHRDRSVRWFFARGSALRDAAGNAVRLIGTTIDVTDRKRTEEALRISEERMQLALDATEDGVWDCNLQTGEMYYSPRCAAIMGYTPEEMPQGGMGSLDWLIHPDDRVARRARLQAHLDGTAPTYCSEHRQRHRSGEWRWILVQGRIVHRTPDGKPLRILGAICDVTEQRRVSEELVLAKEAAEGASRAKSQFLANISHELRTPMNAILGMTDLALNGRLTLEQREYLKTIQDSAQSLLRLLNDILDFARAEAGKLELAQVDFRLRAMLREFVRPVAWQAQRKGLELFYSIEPEVPERLVGDPGRLQQVLLNLLDNAIKFTSRGEIELHIRSELLTADRIRLHCKVRDTGEGIAPHQQEAIFGPFTQGDNSMTRKHGGSGLGLSICRDLCTLMGGRVWVESTPGRGSTFHATMELGLPALFRHETGVPPLDALNGLAVLVVEDHGATRHLLGRMLKAWGMRPTFAPSGAAAIGAVEAQTGIDEPFALLLIDSGLPDVPGWQLVDRLRALMHTLPPVVLMVQQHERETALERQPRVSHILAKPVGDADLQDALLQGLGVSSFEMRLPRERKPAPAKRGPWKILLVEDNVANQRLVTKVLERHGHRVVVAANGLQAVDLAQRQGFDVVLMDVQMPVMDGFEATQHIRRLEQENGTKRVPIMAMTAHALPEDKLRCLSAGMNDYLSKPLDIEQFHDLLATLLELPE